MRGLLTLLASTCALAPMLAHADVSDNLVFCSKLGNSRERIACYDAAARIAANSGSTPSELRMVTRVAADAPPAATFSPPPSQTSFVGFYTALGGGYGISGPRQASIFSTVLANPGLSETVYLSGWNVFAAAGYNVVFGNLLAGLEFDGRISNERGHAEKINLPVQAPQFAILGTEPLSYDIKSDAGVHLSARLGTIFHDTLIFVKFGIGATHIVETGFVDGRNAAFCFRPPVVCESGTLRSSSKAAWIPSAVMGVGIEQNFGPFFIRAQGEVEAAQLQETRLSAGTATSDLYWTARAMAAVGMRF